MTLAHKLTAGAAAILACVLILAGWSWLQEHDARLKAESQAALQQKDIGTLQKTQQAAQNALAGQVKVIEIDKTRPATAQQVVADTQPLGIALPQPVQIQTAPKDPALPNAPAQQQIVLPEADFTAIRDAELTCQETNDKLAACTTVTAAQKQQLTDAEAEAKEWKTAAKGTFWGHVKSAAKWTAVGIGIGAGGVAIAYAINHQNGVTINTPKAATGERR